MFKLFVFTYKTLYKVLYKDLFDLSMASKETLSPSTAHLHHLNQFIIYLYKFQEQFRILTIVYQHSLHMAALNLLQNIHCTFSIVLPTIFCCCLVVN